MMPQLEKNQGLLNETKRNIQKLFNQSYKIGPDTRACDECREEKKDLAIVYN